MKSLVWVVAGAVALLAVPAGASDRHSASYHKRVKKVCDRNQAQALAGRGRYTAFARDGKNLHCGWSRTGNRIDAKAQALRGCKKKAGERCRIVFLKR